MTWILLLNQITCEYQNQHHFKLVLPWYLIIFSTHSLYTGRKDKYVFNILNSSVYKKVMDNNVKDISFNDWDISYEKTLKEPKTALFSNAMIVSNQCQVNLN